jgi:hypothetical protein
MASSRLTFLKLKIRAAISESLSPLKFSFPRSLFLTPAIFLLIAPSIFWNKGNSSTSISVGGDYPHTLFLYPNEFLANLGMHLSQNFHGPEILTPYWSTAWLSLMMKSIGLNPQLVIAGLALSLSFLGCYLLTCEFSDSLSKYHADCAGLISGVVYTFAPLISQNFFTAWITDIYLLPLVPWMCYLLIRYVNEKKLRHAIAGAIALLLSSIGVTDIPNAVPCSLVIFIVVSGYAYTFKKLNLTMLKNVLEFVSFAVLFNCFWMLPYVLWLLNGNYLTGYALSQSQITSSVSFIRSISQYHNVFDTLSLQNSSSMMNAFGWTQVGFSKWFKSFNLFGMMPLAIISAGFCAEALSNVKEKSTRSPLTMFLIGSAIFASLVSLSFPPGVDKIFIWCMSNIPAFVAERNFYITFIIPFLFCASLATGAGFKVISSRFGNKSVVFSSLLIAISFSFYGSPLILGNGFRLHYSDYSSPSRAITSLPLGFLKAASIIQQSNNGPVLSMPMVNSPSDWTYIQGKSSSKQTYIGISPLHYLYGLQSFVGAESFSSVSAHSLAISAESALVSNNVLEFSKIVSNVGIRWILVNQPVMENSYYLNHYSYNSSSVKVQKFSAETINLLHAKLVESSGGFSLYSIPQEFSPLVIDIIDTSSVTPPLINLNNDKQNDPSKINQCDKSINLSSTYFNNEVMGVVKHRIASGACSIIVRVPYNKNLVASSSQNGESVSLTHTIDNAGFNEFSLGSLKRGKLRVSINYGSFHYATGAFISFTSMFGLIVFKRKQFIRRLISSSDHV